MTSLDQRPVVSEGLVNRVKNILLQPKLEWERIDVEPATVKGLFTGYACILAAIGPICLLIGMTVFGVGWAFFSYHPPLAASLLRAILSYALSLVGTYVLALIIDALAPSFDGTKNQIQAFKVAVYSSTAAWVAGVFSLIPALALLGAICSIYSLYLLFLGLPRLMKAPEQKAVGYTVVTVVAAVVVWILIAWITAGVAMNAGGLGVMSVANNGAPAGVVSVGGTRVDLNKLNAATQQMQVAANQMQAAANGQPAPQGAVQAVPTDTLKGFLPTGLGNGYTRTELSAQSGAAGGVGGSSAEGVYTRGDSRITLTVTDMAAMGALATLGGAFGVQSEKETPDGYEKVHMVNGAMTEESWDKASKSGKYGVVVASRFMVQAEGSGADMADLKGAVGAVGVDRLAGLAKG